MRRVKMKRVEVHRAKVRLGRIVGAAFALVTFAGLTTVRAQELPNASPSSGERPNILFAIADDWGWPHAGAYGDPVVRTPTFDRLAREGVLFQHAFVSAPSCTPSRGAILTGMWHWRLRGAANLWSVFPDDIATFPELLERAGYEVGVTGKHWGPGKTQSPGRLLAGKPCDSFQDFMSHRESDKPFFFWLGSGDPHRPFDPGVGRAAGD